MAKHTPPSGPGQPASVASSAPDHDIRAVLRIKPFRRLWAALAISSFGDWLGIIAAAALAPLLTGGDSYTAASFAIAGVFILRLAPAVLLGPLAGALADRLDRRVTMIVGDVIRCALFISIPLVGSLAWLYIATVLVECVALFWMPAKDATVPNLVPRRRLEAANQISLVATYGTALLAALAFSGLALLTGILDNYVTWLGPTDLAFYANALTFLVAAIVVTTMRFPQRTARAAAPPSVFRSVIEGWRFIGSTPLVRGLVLGMLGAFAAAGLVIGPSRVFADDMGAGDPGFGALFGAVFAGLATGMWVGPRLLSELSRRRLFGLALSTAGLFLVLLALVPNMVMAVLFSLAVGACGGVAWVTGYTLLGLEVDDDVRGRTFGFLQSAARVVLVGVLAAGPALAGLIGAHRVTFSDAFALTYSGAAFVFAIAGVLALVMGVVAYRQMDDRPGTGLIADLVRAWGARSGAVPKPVRRPHAGLFVAFEGGDGSGKSTQARLLADWLRETQGHEVVLTREPGATRLGSWLREVLLAGNSGPLEPRTEALLFAADRAHHVSAVVRPALDRGAVVVTDRYADSSIAYQGAGRDLDVDEVERLSRWATDGLVPDLTVLLDLDPAAAASRRAQDADRGEADRMEAEPSEFHERVRQRFLDLARREPHRYLVLDATAPIGDLHSHISWRVRELMPVSVKRRAQLAEQLAAEERAWQARATAEAEVHRMDAALRAPGRPPAGAPALADTAAQPDSPPAGLDSGYPPEPGAEQRAEPEGGPPGPMSRREARAAERRQPSAVAGWFGMSPPRRPGVQQGSASEATRLEGGVDGSSRAGAGRDGEVIDLRDEIFGDADFR